MNTLIASIVIIALLLFASLFTGCASMSTEERNAWSATGRTVVGAVVGLGIDYAHPANRRPRSYSLDSGSGYRK